MRCTRLFCLVVVTALSTTAFLAGSASATSLCKENLAECEGEAMYTNGTLLKAALAEGAVSTLLTSLGSIKCTESSFASESNKLSGKPLFGLLNSLTFLGCKLGKTNCTMVAENIPYRTGTSSEPSQISWSEFEGAMKWKVTCGFVVNCLFSAEALVLSAEGGAPEKLSVNGQEMNMEGFLCPKETKWDAQYEISEPNPLWISQNP